MKKFIVILLLLFGCQTFEAYPVYEHQVIKKINIKNPSFAIIVEKDPDDYYINELENAFIKNNITLYYEDSKVIDSQSESKGVGVAFTGSKVGIGVSGAKGNSTTRIQNINTTEADCIYIFNCYTYTFKVINARTRELIMKGRIKYSFKNEVAMILRELTGI